MFSHTNSTSRSHQKNHISQLNSFIPSSFCCLNRLWMQIHRSRVDQLEQLSSRESRINTALHLTGASAAPDGITTETGKYKWNWSASEASAAPDICTAGEQWDYAGEREVFGRSDHPVGKGSVSFLAGMCNYLLLERGRAIRSVEVIVCLWLLQMALQPFWDWNRTGPFGQIVCWAVLFF